MVKQLLEKYEKIGKIGRPVRNVNQTLNVEFGLSLFQIMDLDEADQMFTVNAWNKFVSGADEFWGNLISGRGADCN